jgi:hypothetical protein
MAQSLNQGGEVRLGRGVGKSHIWQHLPALSLVMPSPA